jgi:hypothetical protein
MVDEDDVVDGQGEEHVFSGYHAFSAAARTLPRHSLPSAPDRNYKFTIPKLFFVLFLTNATMDH